MYKKVLAMLFTGLFFLSINACTNPSTNEQSTDQGATPTQTQNATSTQQDEDTLQISAGSDGVKVNSDKVDVDVNKKGTEIKTKDVNVKLGDDKK